MADLEAVLADVSYLMAMEKSRNQPAARASKKIILPDPRYIFITMWNFRNQVNDNVTPNPVTMIHLILQKTKLNFRKFIKNLFSMQNSMVHFLLFDFTHFQCSKYYAKIFGENGWNEIWTDIQSTFRIFIVERFCGQYLWNSLPTNQILRSGKLIKIFSA